MKKQKEKRKKRKREREKEKLSLPPSLPPPPHNIYSTRQTSLCKVSWSSYKEIRIAVIVDINDV
jgi:hypothetical protein